MLCTHSRRARGAAWLLVSWLLCACAGAQARSQTAPAGQAARCDAAPSGKTPKGGPASPGAPAGGAPPSYDPKSNTITVPDGSSQTIASLGRALGKPEVLREASPGEWLLFANLKIEKGGALTVAAPEARRLKLRSDEAEFVSIKAVGGQLTFDGVCVTSWDPSQDDVDLDYEDGRAFVLARSGAKLTVRDSELSYLGYPANESYGVALRLPGTTGELLRSTFAYNYYGIYMYQASGVVIRGNEVHHSVLYGIDPHTESNDLLIEDNVSHHNGKQGIILAERCSNSVVRNNTVYANTLHGIVIYQGSNGNLVEGNTSYGNGREGININDADGNTVRNNTVYENAKAGIGVERKARGNLIQGNDSRDNGEDGVAVYSDATETTIEGNRLRGNRRYGAYLKSSGNRITDQNEITGNAVGVSGAPDVSRSANRIEGNRTADVME